MFNTPFHQIFNTLFCLLFSFMAGSLLEQKRPNRSVKKPWRKLLLNNIYLFHQVFSHKLWRARIWNLTHSPTYTIAFLDHWRHTVFNLIANNILSKFYLNKRTYTAFFLHSIIMGVCSIFAKSHMNIRNVLMSNKLELMVLIRCIT